MAEHQEIRQSPSRRFPLLLLSLLAGALYPLGFAPFDWWPLSIVSVAFIFFLWERSDRVTALWAAVVYGVAVYGAGVSWVYVSMVNFGNMAPLMAVIAVMLFALYLSLYFVVLVLVYRWLAPRFGLRQRFTLVLPLLWVLFEILRGTLLSGFAWLYLGYIAVDTWFTGWAPIAGVSGVSFVLAWLCGLLAWLAACRQDTQREAAKPGGQNSRLYMQALAGVGAVLAISWGLNQVSWAKPTGERVEVTLIQADIPLAQKWRPENRENLMQTYLAASRAILETDLIVWPEAALPMALGEVPERYLNERRDLDASLVFGAIEREAAAYGVFNSLVALNRDGSGELQTYRKRHLVPFGEFFPYKPLLGWLFETLNIPMSDFTAGGAEQGNVQINGMRMVPTICYEDAYPEDWRHQVADAQAIINISEDAWFGDSLAPHQRLQMARMRAIEFQRPLIRVSNSGLSTVIDDRGQVDAISPQFQPALFTAPVFPLQGETPYAKFGRWPLWAWILACLLFAGWRSFSSRRS